MLTCLACSWFDRLVELCHKEIPCVLSSVCRICLGFTRFVCDFFVNMIVFGGDSVHVCGIMNSLFSSVSLAECQCVAFS